MSVVGDMLRRDVGGRSALWVSNRRSLNGKGEPRFYCSACVVAEIVASLLTEVELGVVAEVLDAESLSVGSDETLSCAEATDGAGVSSRRLRSSALSSVVLETCPSASSSPISSISPRLSMSTSPSSSCELPIEISVPSPRRMIRPPARPLMNRVRCSISIS